MNDDTNQRARECLAENGIIVTEDGAFAHYASVFIGPAVLKSMQAFATSAREEALLEAAEICERHAQSAWDVATAEGQNIAFGSGRNHGARAIQKEILSLITGGGGKPAPTTADTEAAFLVALAEHGVPADVGELLVQGNPRLECPPGALRVALGAVAGKGRG